MTDAPRPARALPNAPAPDREPGVTTGIVTRIVIVATIVLGQLWAIVVALEESLLDHDGRAWLLAGFSLASFVVVLVLTNVDPPRREDRRRSERSSEPRYVSRAVEERRRP